MHSDHPKPKAYAPFVAARYPAPGRPAEKPRWRVLVHRKHVERWNRILDVCGESNARELWDHLTSRPDRTPLLGSVTPMKGRRYGPTEDGMSRCTTTSSPAAHAWTTATTPSTGSMASVIRTQSSRSC